MPMVTVVPKGQRCGVLCHPVPWAAGAFPYSLLGVGTFSSAATGQSCAGNGL